jgi:ABC-type transporter Mla MlaB component
VRGPSTCKNRVGARFALLSLVDCLIEVEQSTDKSVVSIAGALTQDQVPDLLRACAVPRREKVTLDLTNVVSIDAVGLHALRRMRAEGTHLANVPPYIGMLIDA